MSQGTQQEIMFNQQNVFESGKKLVNHQKRLWIIFFNDFSVILIIMFYNKWWLFTKCSSTFQFSLNLIFLQFYYHLFACVFPLTFPILWWLKNFACEFTTIMILCHQFIFNGITQAIVKHPILATHITCDHTEMFCLLDWFFARNP